MSCNPIRQFLLEAGWNAEQRRQAAEYLRHLEQCEACRAAIEDFDVLRTALAPACPPEPAGGWDALRRRIADPIPQRHPNWFRNGLMIAASVLVALGIFLAGREIATSSITTVVIREPSSAGPAQPAVLSNAPPIAPSNPPSNPPSTEPALMPISAGEMSHEVRAFRQVCQVYDGNAGWMMVSQNNSDVGMISEPVSPTRRVLVLRLGLWHGRELVSNSDLLVLAGQKADLTVPLALGQSLHYRIGTSTDEPTQLSLWLELKTPQGGQPLAALSTTLQMRRGQRLTAGKLATSAGEYELKIEFAGAEVGDSKPGHVDP